MTEPIFRKAVEDDIPFLTNSWLESYRHSPQIRGVPNSVYFYYHHKVLEELLTRCTVLVCCYPDRPSQILGYICAELFDTALVVHYVYVKKTFRKLGIGKSLVQEILNTEKPPAVLYTHKTKDMFPIEKKLRQQGWIHHPYMLWVSLPKGWEAQ